jgi:hypothetical protein
VHVVLRDEFTATFRVMLYGNELSEWLGCNDDTCGVNTDMSRVTLNFLSEVDDTFGVRVAFVEFSK